MNLVQINERLKEMPLQAVQQYANGMNPEIPPYLALGELQRRETAHKKAALAQGAASGPQPSVKEQIEQKAGLMALQMQQKQAQMQGAAPQAGPIPGNVPQPVPQPQAAMACGGIARLPVRPGMYDFAGGGIIAFAGEDESEVDLEKAKKKRLRHYTLQEQGADYVARKEAERENDPEVQRKIQQVRNFESSIADLLAGTGAQGVAKPAAAPAPEPRAERQEEAPPPRLMDGRPNPAYIDYMNRKGPPVSSVYPDESKRGTAAGLAALPAASSAPATRLPSPPPRSVVPPSSAPRQNAPTAAPAQAAPAQAADSGIPGLNDPAFLAAAKRAMEEPNQEQAIKDYKARMAAMGLEGLYGKDQERRIRDLDAQYKQGLENRGLERLMRVLQARNMGEYGSRYLGSIEQERAADLAQAARMNELLAGIEGKRREEGMTGVKTVGEELEKRRGTAAQAATSLSGSQMQAGVSRANQLSQNQTQLQIAELDRKLRERLHNTPAAQIPSIEKEMLDVYTQKFGGDKVKAYEHIKTLMQENKAELSQPQQIQKLIKEWDSMDAAAKIGLKNNEGIKTVDDYIDSRMKTINRLTGRSATPGVPADIQNILKQYPPTR